jgi:hypothetical protein
MNLALTSSLISLGREVFDQITASPKAQAGTHLQPGSESFVTEMKEAQQGTTGPNLARLSESQLRYHLLEDPTVASFLENNPNCQIFLQKRADGTMQLGSSSGQTLVLEQNSPVNQTCLAYYEKSMLNGTSQSPLRPDAVILKS